MARIYYAHSISGNHIDNEWTPDDIIPVIQSYGHQVLSEDFYNESIQPLQKYDIFQRDIAMLKTSDLVIANITNPSLWVWYELGYAECHDIRVICFYQAHLTTNISGMILGNQYFHILPIHTMQELKNMIESL
jgi:hypothetical protein